MGDNNGKRAFEASSPVKSSESMVLEAPSTPKKQRITFDFWKGVSSPTACSKEAINISDLIPRYYPNRSLTMRVIYFHSFQSRGGKTIFKFQGQDETGKVQCVSFDDSSNILGSVISNLNDVINIIDFRVIAENPSYPNGLNNGIEVVVLPGSTVKKLDSQVAIPALVFDFVALDALDNTAVSSKIDVLDIVVHEFEGSGNSNSKGPNLTLAITDRSKKTVRVAFWKTMEDFEDISDFPVVIIRKAAVQEYNGERSLNCGYDAVPWIRPNVPEAKDLEVWFENERQKMKQALNEDE